MTLKVRLALILSIVLLAGTLSQMRPVVHKDSKASRQAAIERRASQPPSALFFLSRNGGAAVLLLSGAVTGGLSTVITLAAIGWRLGVESGEMWHHALPVKLRASTLLPHGPIELVGIGLAALAGMLGPTILLNLARDRSIDTQVHEFARLTAWAFALITAAACLESWLTPLVILWAVQP